jgi:hypothetical protein
LGENMKIRTCISLSLLFSAYIMLNAMEESGKESKKEQYLAQAFQLKRASSWSALPTELKFYILSFVPEPDNYQDWITAQQVSKEFNALVTDEFFLNDLAQRIYTHNPKRAIRLLEGAIEHENIALTSALTQGEPGLMDYAKKLFFDAANSGDLKTIETLHKAGIDLNSKDDAENTPLHLALYNRHPELTLWLIDKGANINLADKWGRSPLMVVSALGDPELAELLIEKGAQVNAQDTDLQTPLIDAIKNRHLQIARLLIKQGAHPNVENNAGDTPLIDAVRSNNKEIVKLLIQSDAAINYVNKRGNSAIDEARRLGNSDLINLLQTQLSASSH